MNMMNGGKPMNPALPLMGMDDDLAKAQLVSNLVGGAGAGGPNPMANPMAMASVMDAVDEITLRKPRRYRAEAAGAATDATQSAQLDDGLETMMMMNMMSGQKQPMGAANMAFMMGDGMEDMAKAQLVSNLVSGAAGTTATGGAPALNPMTLAHLDAIDEITLRRPRRYRAQEAGAATDATQTTRDFDGLEEAMMISAMSGGQPISPANMALMGGMDTDFGDIAKASVVSSLVSGAGAGAGAAPTNNLVNAMVRANAIDEITLRKPRTVKRKLVPVYRKIKQAKATQ